MKKYILSIIILFPIILSSQITIYNLDGNLQEEVAGLDATYLSDGLPSNDEITTVPGFDEGGVAIELDSSHGIELPLALNNLLDYSKSVEFALDFQATYVYDGKANKNIIELKNDWHANSTGIAVYMERETFFELNGNYRLYFTYSDGGFNTGVPDHPGHYRTEVGSFNEGDWVKMRLILDFEANTWEVLANSQSTSGVLDDFYDADLILSTIKENPIKIGWGANVEDDLLVLPEQFTSKVAFDNLQIFSPREAGDLDVLNAALLAMTNHVNGSAVLDEEEMKEHFADIQFNFNGNLEAAKTSIFNFTNAYESVNEPIYADRTKSSVIDLPLETQAMLLLQQGIHDDLFVEGNIENAAGIKFEAAEAFPGRVRVDAPRLENQKVEVLVENNFIPGARLLHDTKDIKRPTGYYAAPGEMVTVNLDPSIASSGLKVLVGAHDFDLSSRQDDINRFVRISKTFDLDKASVNVANPFGGGIYLLIPLGLDLGWHEITISGAVKSPYYSYRTGRVTPTVDWMNELNAENTAWVDVESDKYMFTVPLAMVDQSVDPAALMEKWNMSMDGFRVFGGRPLERHRAEYYLVDARLPYNAFGSGYPQIIGEQNAPYDPILLNSGTSPFAVLQEGYLTSGLSTTFHEMGHGARHPTLPEEDETVVEVNASIIFNTAFEEPLDTAFKYSGFQQLDFEQATIDWIMTHNFRNNMRISCSPIQSEDVCAELRYQHRGFAKYIDIARLFGWEGMSSINERYFERWKAEPPFDYRVETDDYIREASIALEVNMAPLFHFWGILPSESLVSELAEMEKSQDILRRLIEYLNFAPRTLEDFIPWRDANYINVESIHQPRYDDAIANWDSENRGQQIVDQILFIIEKYYGEVDFDNDGYLVSEDCDDTNAEINPEAEEIANNGIDENCDGEDLTSSLEDLILREVTLSPNPVQSELRISSGVVIERLQIYNYLGQVVYATNLIANAAQIDLGNYPEGTYLLKVWLRDRGIGIRKFVKI